MFVGESACFLLVFLFSLFRLLTRRSKGYTPLPSAQEDANAALKPLLSKDHRRPLRGWAIFLLALPSTCDIVGTTLMNGGLLFVAASIYQMTRGALVLFVGLFSVLFLKRRLFGYQWFALLVVVLGVGLVGVAGALDKGKDVLNEVPPPPIKSARDIALDVLLSARDAAAKPVVWKTVIGVIMIAGAQIFTATQFVFEEHILEIYEIEPLKMVGWEGVFGFIVTVIGMGILHFLIGRTETGQLGYFDAVEGFRQFVQVPGIFLSSVLIMISIGGFNFFGLSVTRSVSATSRSTIDTCRTLFIWIVSLGLGWESFKWLQIVGFVLLVYGTFLFNDLVGAPWACCVKRRVRSHEPLLQEEPIEHL